MTTAIATVPDAGVLATGSERALGIGHDSLPAAFGKYRAFRASVAELSALDDRQLTDVGIARPAIGEHARKAVYGK